MNKYLTESLKFLQGLELKKVEYLIIGGVEVNIHGPSNLPKRLKSVKRERFNQSGQLGQNNR